MFKSSLISSFQIVKHYNPKTCLCLLRCARDTFREVWGVLTLLRRVDGREVAMRVVYIAGSLRTAQRAAIKKNVAVLSVIFKNKDDLPLAIDELTEQIRALDT